MNDFLSKFQQLKYKPYPKYKESGVEWLGEIPEHWEEVRFKFLTDITTGDKDTENKVSNGKYPFYVRSKNIEKINSYSYDGEAILTAGDGDIGKIFHYINGKFDFHQRVYMFYNFKKSNTLFLYYYLSENLHKEVIKLSAKTTVDSLRLPMLQNFVVSLPPLQEQQTIANYLDKATAKIDTLIQKQEQLIELLKEKRQALISHAVTKGLNPDVKMKDSGIEWLGEIPEHWISSPLKFLLEEPLMYGANESADRNNPNDPRYIRITDIREDGKLHTNTFRSLPMEIAKPYLLKNNSLLLARSGATVGKTFLYDESWGIACFAGYLIKATLLPNIANSKFVSYFTKTTNYWQWLNSSQIQATIENVSAEKYANLNIPLPSIEEQLSIVAYIDEKTSKIDTLINKATKAIELLKERRTALISAVVTGKIDVRKYA